jgi:hypothetical protein
MAQLDRELRRSSFGDLSSHKSQLTSPSSGPAPKPPTRMSTDDYFISAVDWLIKPIRAGGAAPRLSARIKAERARIQLQELRHCLPCRRSWLAVQIH